jgi:hypothetical protein
LYYYIKSKVEATALGFHTIEEEFMPDIIVKTKTGEESLAQAIMHYNVPSLEFKE